MTQAPREWQKRALKLWKSAGMRGIAKVVTGGGKTTFAGMCGVEALRSGNVSRIVIVVPTLALADQWYVALLQDFKIQESDISIWSGRSRVEVPTLWSIATFPTAAKRAKDLSQGNNAMLVVDECHHAGAPTFLSLADSQWGATLGLSATPEREYDTTFSDVIEPVLGPILIEYLYDQALDDGIICPFSLVNLKIPLTKSEDAEYQKITKSIAVAISREGADSPKVKALLQKRSRVSALAHNRLAAALQIVLLNQGQRIMVFDESIDRIELIASFLNSKGITAATYHSRMSHSIARDNFASYRSGSLKILLTCHALDEGANVPETQVAVIVASTSSARQRVQRLGRVLRPARNKLTARVYTIFATESEERSLRLPTAASSVEWQEMKIG